MKIERIQQGSFNKKEEKKKRGQMERTKQKFGEEQK